MEKLTNSQNSLTLKRKAGRKPAINQALLRDLWFNVGYLTALDRENDSISDLKRIIELDPGDAAAFMYLGRIYLKLSDATRAEYYLACAAELNGSEYEIALNYGTCLAINGYYQKSVPWLRNASKAAPENPAAHFNLGMSLLMINKDEEAMKCFSRTLELNSRHLPSAYNLGIYFLRNKLPQRARHYFEICLEIDPEYAKAWQQMLRLSLRQKDLLNAEIFIKKALEMIPDDPGLRVDQTAFDNISRSETEIGKKVRQALDDLPDLVPVALERITEFRKILKDPTDPLPDFGVQ